MTLILQNVCDMLVLGYGHGLFYYNGGVNMILILENVSDVMESGYGYGLYYNSCASMTLTLILKNICDV